MKRHFLPLINKFIHHELISGSFYIFLGALCANVLGFLFNLFLVRNLTVIDYAIYASLLSVISLVSIPLQSFQTVIVKFATNYFSKNEEAEASTLYVQAIKLILIIAFSIFIIASIFSSPIASFLNINSVNYIIFTGLIIGVGYIGVVSMAFLQSLLRFGYVAFLNSFGVVLKLLFAVIFVFLGWHVYGALGAIFLAYMISTILGFIPLRWLFFKKHKKIKLPVKEIIFYAVPTCIGIISLLSFITMDIILVKHFFPATEAGIYAGIGLIARALFYFTQVVPIVMFPLIIKRKNVGQDPRGLLYLALGLVTFASCAITFGYYLFPQVAIFLFLGGNGYLAGAQYLTFSAIFISLFSIVNVFVNFFLSLQKTLIGYFVGIMALAQICLIFALHKSIYEILAISSILMLVLLVGLLLYYVRLYGKTQIFNR